MSIVVGMASREEGFTLVELLAVMVVMTILLAISIGFMSAARVQAGDATAKSNIDVALPAIRAYSIDNDGFTGMTVASLQSSYSKGIGGIEILSAGPASYCVKSTAEGRTWFKNGPDAPITTTSCS